jgi:K+-transporting ATPase ATPase C chain
MVRSVLIAIRMYVVVFLVLGLAYPLLVTGISQVALGHQANGSVVRDENGRVIGSELIGQQFESATYFHSRPSAAGDGYDALASGGSNLGPTSRELADTVAERARQLRAENPGMPLAIPADAVTASASGLDPDISPAYALAQVSRVADERGLSEQEVRDLVLDAQRGRDLGFIGEPRVNVLLLNSALDAKTGVR